MHEKYINPFTDFGFKRLFEQAEIAKLNPEELFNYEESVKVYRDLFNVVETAERKGHKKGLEEGRAEGRAEGILENKKESARKMKSMGFSTKSISDITGLGEDEINNIEI